MWLPLSAYYDEEEWEDAPLTIAYVKDCSYTWIN